MLYAASSAGLCPAEGRGAVPAVPGAHGRAADGGRGRSVRREVYQGFAVWWLNGDGDEDQGFGDATRYLLVRSVLNQSGLFFFSFTPSCWLLTIVCLLVEVRQLSLVLESPKSKVLFALRYRVHTSH